MNLNKVILIGNITKSVELKALPNGSKVANFSIATNRNWKNDKGEKQEEVEFHNLVAFGKQAETLAQYCVKGQQLYVEGRLKTRNWEQEGVKRYSTDIIVENFQFGRKPENVAKEDNSEFKPKAGNTDIDYPGEELGESPF